MTKHEKEAKSFVKEVVGRMERNQISHSSIDNKKTLIRKDLEEMSILSPTPTFLGMVDDLLEKDSFNTLMQIHRRDMTN